MRLRWALALLASSLWAELAHAQGPRPEDATVSVVLGGTVSMATATEAHVNPFARVGVEAPLSDWRMTPRLIVRLDLNGLPGKSVALADPSTFTSAEFSGAICQPVSERVYVDICAGLGVASRLPGDPEPRDGAVLWGDARLRFGRAGRGWLELGFGRDQRLDGLWRWAVSLQGAVKLYEISALKGSLQIFGDAIAGLEPSSPGGPRTSLMRIGIAIGAGR